MCATIITIDADDQISSSRADLNTNFANLNSDKIETSAIDTDTTLSANSDSKIPSQKAVKAYFDSNITANASESAKGVVEEATDAEVTSGTATGGTGAKLFITPAKLATRFTDPTFLPVVDKLETSGASSNIISGTTSEINVFSISIPAGSLSTNNAVRAKIYISSEGITTSGETTTVRLKYGSTTVATGTITSTGNAGGLSGYIEAVLIANASASAQRGTLLLDFIDNQTDTFIKIGNATSTEFVRIFATGTATENSANALNFIVSVQSSQTTATMTLTGYIVELIR